MTNEVMTRDQIFGSVVATVLRLNRGPEGMASALRIVGAVEVGIDLDIFAAGLTADEVLEKIAGIVEELGPKASFADAIAEAWKVLA